MKKNNLQERVEETLHGQTVIKRQDGMKVRRKRGIDAERIYSEDKFKRTRENMSEFGAMAKAGKVLRDGLAGGLRIVNDSKMALRLSSAFNTVVKSDVTNPRGYRNVLDGNLELLKGFQFNEKSPLSTTLLAPFTASLDRAAGEAKVVIPAFSIDSLLYAPKGATHVVFIAAAAAIDFVNMQADGIVVESQAQALIAAGIEETVLTAALPANSTHPLFLTFGVYFVQEVGGVKYMLSSGAYNSLALVAVSPE